MKKLLVALALIVLGCISSIEAISRETVGKSAESTIGGGPGEKAEEPNRQRTLSWVGEVCLHLVFIVMTQTLRFLPLLACVLAANYVFSYMTEKGRLTDTLMRLLITFIGVVLLGHGIIPLFMGERSVSLPYYIGLVVASAMMLIAWVDYRRSHGKRRSLVFNYTQVTAPLVLGAVPGLFFFLYRLFRWKSTSTEVWWLELFFALAISSVSMLAAGLSFNRAALFEDRKLKTAIIGPLVVAGVFSLAAAVALIFFSSFKHDYLFGNFSEKYATGAVPAYLDLTRGVV